MEKKSKLTQITNYFKPYNPITNKGAIPKPRTRKPIMGLSSISQYREPEKINTSSDPEFSINMSQLESEISEINKNDKEDKIPIKQKQKNKKEISMTSQTSKSQKISMILTWTFTKNNCRN